MTRSPQGNSSWASGNARAYLRSAASPTRNPSRTGGFLADIPSACREIPPPSAREQETREGDPLLEDEAPDEVPGPAESCRRYGFQPVSASLCRHGDNEEGRTHREIHPV